MIAYCLSRENKRLPMRCHDCWQQGNQMIQISVCQVCGKPIEVKKFQYDRLSQIPTLRGAPRPLNPNYHEDCGKQVFNREICKSCHNPFDVLYSDKIEGEVNQTVLPSYCPKCRMAIGIAKRTIIGIFGGNL